MVEKYTTMCEFWTLKQSHNHVMTGSIDAFFFKSLAGINLDENYPGCKFLTIKPFIPDNMDFVKASIETIKGEVKSSWTKTTEGLKIYITIPVNASADVYIPQTDPSKIYENSILASESRGVKYEGTFAEMSKYFVESGEYEFVIKK